ncbi:methionine--tRNA ligase [Rhizobium bangladeshense]|uniref:Methionine--tRNA ligase n=1 Tax=Rhizobium bangladeshense TaxID=1138189 RepID=A0ABS7LMP5_9HYPH|nr:methionine--tRNA ligase [Rhizobium bangladeshense]MBX4869433.1 methionine--tRNA ligase [Rhizobium bangladeshense]MBX4874827.1 methionine--tRNA ligase [Rhizobium bangladeshense]MBX4885132.1 methionine--tRNA ligase [Rhizobium bangladeshense]MBX4897186.1 methionine--tRNA ligase [Rhizobium bangladeshense]MBY3592543.1 methionine--tRNA ligase [Rhizobium bangladeshense]
MTDKSLYLTTTIPYVNASPHIGFALELVQADALARYRKAEGWTVRLQTGSDENSLKNVLAAERAGCEPSAFVADNARRFHELQTALNIDADDFIRTSSDPRHRPAVERLWRACEASGDLYRKSYAGLYCTGCEQFYSDGELAGGCCPEHLTKPEEVSETNWFFRLSRYERRLRTAIETNELRINPPSRRNEVLALIKSGLNDFSVSRSSERARGWGIPVPGDPEQTIYVWYDALGNYLSALGYGEEAETAALRQFWLDAHRREHLVGKGVTRFHAVYWPAILLSAGLPLPTTIHVHGYVTVDGRKIGKSNGNAVDPLPLAADYGADALRYFLLRHIRAHEDGDFTVERLEAAYNGELISQLGNLFNRILSIAAKQKIVVCVRLDETDEGKVSATRLAVKRAMDTASFHEALAAVFDLVSYANKRVVELEPWAIVKALNPAAEAERFELETRLLTSFAALGGLLREIVLLLAPFLPETAETLTRQIDILGGAAPSDVKIVPVFPKLN